jgi:hypothetical protein
MSRDVAAVAFHDPRPPGKHIAAGAAEDLRRQSGRGRPAASSGQWITSRPACCQRDSVAASCAFSLPLYRTWNPIRQALTKSLLFILSPFALAPVYLTRRPAVG